MYDPPRIGRGAAVSSLAAGPIFLTVMTLGHADGLEDAARILLIILLFSMFAVPFSFMLAIVPNLLGAWTLTHLGRGNDAMRLPVVWAIVGALVAGLFIARSDPSEAGMIAAFATTGGACALICRCFTRWPEPATLQPEDVR